MRKRFAATALALLVGACTGAMEDEDAGLAGMPAALPGDQAICEVEVSGQPGLIPVEHEYLPRVLWCEVTNEERHPEFLKAHAIAARTFLYKRMRTRSPLPYMRNGVSDQMYWASRCSGKVPQEYIDAVHETRGMVMVKPSSHIHSGFYRAGTRRVCRRYNQCYGEPCMSQLSALACAREGQNFRQILETFYGETNAANLSEGQPALSIVKLDGPCTVGNSLPADPMPHPTQCLAGKGSCQPTYESCYGSYKGGVCPGANFIQCCVGPDTPPPPPGGCTYRDALGEQAGQCQPSTDPCAGGYVGGQCPGQGTACCLPRAPSWGTCNVDGVAGTCEVKRERLDGSYFPGHCPGSSEIQCFVPTASWGPCSGGLAGVCQATEISCVTGGFVPYKCPGPGNIQCCSQ